MANKLNLSTKEDKVYGAFTKDYRLSKDIIDRRDGRGEIRARTDMYGRGGIRENTNARQFYEEGARGKARVSDTSTTRAANRSTTAPDDNTPDDYSGAGAAAGYGGSVSQTTPNSTRKVDAEEAVRKTHFERN